MTGTMLGFASLMVAALLAALWFQALRRVEIPENRAGFVAAWIVAAALGLAGLARDPGWIGGVPAGLGAFASVLFLATVAISRQKVGEGAIEVGATIPHFTAPDEHGQTFDSQSLAGHPVLIKFFRAHW